MRWVATAAVLALILPGCVDFSQPARTNLIGLVRIDVAAPVVTTGRVTLAVISTLDNLDAQSGHLNLTVKAYDLATSMLVASRTVDVGTLRKDISRDVEVRLDLARASGYRIEVLVEQDTHIVQRGQVEVSNVAALEPTVYDTGLRIANIDVQVLDTKDKRVHVRCSVYFTNEAGKASRPLRLQLRARDVATGILADEKWVDVSAIAADETRIGTVEMTLPDGFNYELLAALWDGNVVVETGQGKVQFLPTYQEGKDTRLVVSHPDISVFAEPGRAYALQDTDGDSLRASGPYYGNPSASTTAATPGIGAAALAAALVALALVRRRNA